MITESRSLENDEGNIEINILSSGNRFYALSLKYNEDYIDGEEWIKQKLYTALWGYVYNQPPIHSGVLEEFDRKDYQLLYEMLVRAETLGWMEHIKL